MPRILPETNLAAEAPVALAARDECHLLAVRDALEDEGEPEQEVREHVNRRDWRVVECEHKPRSDARPRVRRSLQRDIEEHEDRERPALAAGLLEL